MNYYETVFMVRQDLSEKQVKDLTDEMTKLLEDQGGKIHKTEHWGLRTLAYRIEKNRKAHYVLIESEAAGTAIIELERILRLNEDVLRSMSVRRRELSENPSPIMDKDKSKKEAA